jgi:MFS transporter, DHA1 family, inner membrane transport protein
MSTITSPISKTQRHARTNSHRSVAPESDRSLPVGPTTNVTGYVSRRRISWLALGTFALGTESMVIGGVLPEIAASFGTTESRAALLVSAYALTYAAAAPLTGFVASRFAPKQWLIGALLAFALANVFAAVAPSFAVLLLARVVAGVIASSYTPNASAAASSLAAPEERGRALSLVYFGMTFATVVGVPIGTVLADFANWRSTFWFVSALSIIGAAGIAVFLPKVPRRAPLQLRAWVQTFRNPAIQRIIAVTMVASVSQFAVFTLFALFVRDFTNNKALIPVALFIFGAIAVFGNSFGGTLADKRGPRFTATLAISGMGLSFALFAIASLLPVGLAAGSLGLIGLALWGVSGWAFLAPLQLRITQVAGAAAPLALGVNATSLYVGIALGGLVASGSLALVGVGFAALVGAVIAGVAALLAKRI